MKKNILKIKLLNKKAFSIGEVMLSVFILGVTMVTILSLYSTGLKSFMDERDSVMAAMLAQEGVELARNIRDNNWADRTSVTDTDPKTFENFNGYLAKADSLNCRVDINSTSINGGDCGNVSKQLNIVNIAGAGYYMHDNGTSTKFRRTISLNYDNNNLIVTSFVSWDGNNPDTADCKVENKCVFSESTLTDWGTGT